VPRWNVETSGRTIFLEQILKEQFCARRVQPMTFAVERCRDFSFMALPDGLLRPMNPQLAFMRRACKALRSACGDIRALIRHNDT